MRIYLVSPLLPSFVVPIGSPRKLAAHMLTDGREPRDWIGCSYAINDLGERGVLEASDRSFIIEWTGEIVGPSELQDLMARRLGVLGWQREAFMPSVSLIQNVAEFERVYRKFPDRAERAGTVKGCIYVAFVSTVIAVVIVWRLRRFIVLLLP